MVVTNNLRGRTPSTFLPARTFRFEVVLADNRPPRHFAVRDPIARPFFTFLQDRESGLVHLYPGLNCAGGLHIPCSGSRHVSVDGNRPDSRHSTRGAALLDAAESCRVAPTRLAHGRDAALLVCEAPERAVWRRRRADALAPAAAQSGHPIEKPPVKRRVVIPTSRGRKGSISRCPQTPLEAGDRKICFGPSRVHPLPVDRFSF